MAKIKLSDAFEVIPEGTYVFKITKVEYDETFGKLKLAMETEDMKYVYYQNYNFFLGDGSINDKALKSFSYLARTILGNNADEVDPNDLLNHSVQARIEHQEVPSKDNPNEKKTFARMTDLKCVAVNSVADLLNILG